MRLVWKWFLKPFLITVGILTCVGTIYLCGIAMGMHHAMTGL